MPVTYHPPDLQTHPAIPTETRIASLRTVPTSGHVLLLDHDHLTLLCLRELIEGWGCRVVAAEGPESALAKLAAEAQPFDMLVLDFDPAAGDPLPLLRRLRQRLGSTIPCVLFCNSHEAAFLHRLGDPALWPMEKPVPPRRLYGVLRHLLS